MPTPERIDVDVLRTVVTTFRDTVWSHAATLNQLNVYPVPDGDTGTNMARTLDAVIDALDSAPRDLAATCDAISHGSLMGARGNSGVILSQILRGLATTYRDDAGHDDAGPDGAGSAAAGAAGTGDDDGPAVAGHRFAVALRAAATGAYAAVMKPVEGTILTVAREAADAAEDAAGTGAALTGVVEAARVAGAEALERTPELLPALRDAGVVDAGGAGLLLFFDAVLHVLTGRPLPAPPHVADDVGTHAASVVHGSAADAGTGASDTAADRRSGVRDVADLRYEVMFLCAIDDARVEGLKRAWATLGDSIVVVGGDGTWNCHVHTDDVGGAIEAALDAGGRPSRIRVTDLLDQVHDAHGDAPVEAPGDSGAERRESVSDPVACAVVAVASGPGLERLFRSAGVAEVVAGGQTANPSTAELLDAVERAPSSSVVVLPNNKNVIGVAEQLDALTGKRVGVVPTRSMPAALAALVVHDPGADLDTNVRTMTDAAASVAAGEVTRAVRASRTAAGEVNVGDWIGVADGMGVVSVASGLEDAAVALLDTLVDGESEIVTVVCGADAPDEVTMALEGWLADEHGDVEVEVHDGGQPLYPYLFGVE